MDLNVEDIETILNTLVYDGKIERNIISASASFSSAEQVNLYRAINPILPQKVGSGLVRTPCGICQLIDNCYEAAPINPKTCVYMKEWLDPVAPTTIKERLQGKGLDPGQVGRESAGALPTH